MGFSENPMRFGANRYRLGMSSGEDTSRALRIGELSILMRSFSENGVNRTEERWEWQYSGYPGLGTITEVMNSSGSSSRALGAAYSVACYPGVLGRSATLLAQSFDTLTDLDHRGRGYFTQLAKTTYARAQDIGVDLIFGFPNGNSIHGFEKNLDWIVMDPVPFLFRPLRLDCFTRGVPKLCKVFNPPMPIRRVRLNSREELLDFVRFESGHEKLWEMVEEQVGVAVRRTSTFLNWRFVETPMFEYQKIELKRNGEIEGFVVFRVAEKHSTKIGYVMELIHRPGDTKTGAILLNAALRRMRSQGASISLAWNFAHSFSRKGFRRAGFLSMPVNLRPIELHFGIRVLNPRLGEVAKERSNWYLSYSDSDTV
jgi:hypothetical protein